MAMSNGTIAAGLKMIERDTGALYGVRSPRKPAPRPLIGLKRVASRPPAMPASIPASD